MKRFVLVLALLAALAIPVAAMADSHASHSYISIPPMKKGAQRLIMHFDGANEKKCMAVAQELKKLGWKMEKTKSGLIYPSLILEMDEYGYLLTIQVGGVEKIPLKMAMSPEVIARKINKIRGGRSLVMDNNPSAGEVLGRDLLDRRGIGQ